jgi:fibronectin-binding autotransporter adhesin
MSSPSPIRTGGGDWNTASNWTPAGGPPEGGDTALLPTAGTAYTVTSNNQANTVSVLNTATTATLAINSNELDITGGTGAGANAGTIAVGDGAKLGIEGAFNNTGTLKTLASGSHIDLDAAVITGGKISTVLGSFIDTLNSHASSITGATVTNAGTLEANHSDLTVIGAVTNTGILAVANGSHLDITGAVTGAGTATIDSSGLLEFGAASSAKVTFLDATGTLQLDHATTLASKFTGTVTGFHGSDDIDFGAINYTTGDAQQLSFAENSAHTSGILTVKDGTHTETLTLVGNYVLADFHAVADAHHHVDLLFV